jgi:pimeloyl-ACP methyl ester carboxylesterase
MNWYDGIVHGWRCAWCDRLLPANESNGIDPGTCDCPAGLADAADYEGRAMKISRLSIGRPPPLHSQHPPFHRCEKPVLLLYGLFATPRIVDVLTHRFRRRGYCAFSINLGGLFGRFNSAPIEELAALLSNQVDRICRHHGIEWLDIVGHSEGGLIGRYYVQKLNGAKHVSSLVTLGTPHPWYPLGVSGAPCETDHPECPSDDAELAFSPGVHGPKLPRRLENDLRFFPRGPDLSAFFVPARCRGGPAPQERRDSEWRTL